MILPVSTSHGLAQIGKTSLRGHTQQARRLARNSFGMER
ncbi:MAG: hypothetical protein ACI92S_003552 [Planctomycetaceae bacterium]|jgi:hypothetical protein